MVLSEKYQLIQKLARDFCEAEIPSELQDEIDRTGLEELLFDFGVVVDRHEHGGHVTATVHGLDMLECSQPIHLRHVEVHQDQVRDRPPCKTRWPPRQNPRTSRGRGIRTRASSPCG